MKEKNKLIIFFKSKKLDLENKNKKYKELLHLILKQELKIEEKRNEYYLHKFLQKNINIKYHSILYFFKISKKNN